MKPLVYVLLVVMSGCVSNAQLQQWLRDGDRPVVCEIGESCDAAWGAAIAYISRESKYRFQQQTDFLISTYCDVNGSTDPCYMLTKRGVGGGKAKIETTVGCNNVFTCNPNAALVRSQVVGEMLAAISQVSSGLE